MGRAPFLAAALTAACLLDAQTPKPQTPKPKLGDNSAGSRAQPAHIIALRDLEGDTIQPGDRHTLPFSVAQTCGGECHDVAAVSRGWHFNPAQNGALAGRNGQPWMLVDRDTATQIPLSYRAWPGTYRPQEVGMSAREFALHFGGRTAGGIGPEAGASAGDRARWSVSGELEVNCLVCHDASAAYDQATYANQVALENFRFAAAAASGLGLVTGQSKQMPDTFDYLLPNSVEDSLQPLVPKVEYAPADFLPSGKVAFDIVRAPKNSQCYYCHTNVDVALTGATRFQGHEDIHLARGIGCNECHRHGLDHNVMRGYEKDALTCEGCHAEGNAMGAPHPDHEGLPPLHLAKLTCTACHSGPLPEQSTRQFKNGMTHGLGEFNVNKSADALPHLYYPVFARNAEGKLAPNRLVWPSFWGRVQNGKVTPLLPEQVKKAMAKAKIAAAPAIDEQWVEAVLRVLDEAGPSGYIAGGKLHRLEGGKLHAEDNAQAQPYLWPIAHDVRPATQALGAKGCQDCHSTQAAIFFGKVAVDSPLASERAATVTMAHFEKNLDVEYQARLARSWQYRGLLKAIGIGAAVVLLLVLLAYGLRAVDRISAATAGKLWMAVNGVGLATFLLVVYTAYFHKEDPLSGDALLWHVTVAPAFALAAIAVTFFWAHRSALAGGWMVVLRDVFFWSAVALAIPTFGSILAAMFPLAGTEGQQELIAIHRLCGQLLSGAGLLFAGFALFLWWRRRAE